MQAYLESLKTAFAGLPHSWVLASGVAAVAFVVTVGVTVAWRAASRSRREGRERRGQIAYIQGLNHMLNGQTTQALEAFSRAVKLDGDNIDAYLRLGTLFRMSGQPSRAVRVHKSLLMRPKLPEQLAISAVLELALDYRESGSFDKAAEVLEKVTTLNTDQTVPLRELKEAYEKAKRWKDAINAGKRLIKHTRSKDYRSLAPLHLAWGKDLLDGGDTEGALQAFREAIKVDPRCVEAHLALGDVMFEMGQAKAAISAWERLMQESPQQFSYALERLERAYFAADQYDDLRRAYVRYLDTYPEDPSVRLALAEFYMRRGRMDEASKELERVGEDSLGAVRANLHLARIYKDRAPEEGPWRERLAAATQSLKSFARTFQCRDCGASKGEYFWRCPKCDKLGTGVRSVP